MPGLVDIAPLHETVDIRGTPIKVIGVSAEGIAMLLFRFPELRKALGGGNLDIDVNGILSMGQDIVAAVITAGVDKEGASREDVEASVKMNMVLEEQVRLIAAILRVTLPNGVGPFVESLEELSGVVEAAASQKAPGTKSRKR